MNKFRWATIDDENVDRIAQTMQFVAQKVYSDHRLPAVRIRFGKRYGVRLWTKGITLISVRGHPMTPSVALMFTIYLNPVSMTLEKRGANERCLTELVALCSLISSILLLGQTWRDEIRGLLMAIGAYPDEMAELAAGAERDVLQSLVHSSTTNAYRDLLTSMALYKSLDDAISSRLSGKGCDFRHEREASSAEEVELGLEALFESLNHDRSWHLPGLEGPPTYSRGL